MSVSHNINTDNHWSQQSQIPHPAVEENKKWRTRMNNGEHCNLGLVSPQRKPTSGEEGIISRRLSEIEDFIPKSCPTKLNGSPHPRIYKTFFVRLAEESPKRCCDEFSDSSTYDSFNSRETDVCRDSSDTESNSSYLSDDIGATIKVVEYEVASASNSDDLFTNDSSSGTDDILLAAFATAICHTPKYSSDFADTEEDSSDSDSTYDSEFSSADYWVCVKCKNRQNNPMFRYCEKCYQIRKTHFPPRPRLRKSRSAIKRHRSPLGFPPVKRSTTIPETDESHKRRRIEEPHSDEKLANLITPTSSSNSLQSGPPTPRFSTGMSITQLNSTAESSSDEDDNNESRFFKHSKVIECDKSRAASKYFPTSGMVNTTNKLNDPNSPAQHLRTAAKRKLSKAHPKFKSLIKRKCYDSNAIPSNTENETDFALSQSMCGSSQGTQKDSGFSSAPSSQERKSSCEPHDDEEDDNCAASDGGDNGNASSDTVCDELNDSDVAEMCEEKNCIPSTLEFDFNTEEQTLERHVSDIVVPSTASEANATLVQSVSECSDAYTNVQASSSNPELLNSVKQSKLRSLQPSIQSTEADGDFPSYGSCMTCLTEPKNGVFVHSRFLHLCCCYKCAVKIWTQNKKCPICNCAVKNVKKLFVY